MTISVESISTDIDVDSISDCVKRGVIVGVPVGDAARTRKGDRVGEFVGLSDVQFSIDHPINSE